MAGEKDYYTTREAAEYLGISFRTVKRWIYKGKIRTRKSEGGWHLVPKSELKRLRKEIQVGREKSSFLEGEILSILRERRIVYLRQIQVLLEDDYAHWDVTSKLGEMTPSKVKTKTYREHRWYYDRRLQWREVERDADIITELIDIYDRHERRFEKAGITYLDYAEYLVERSMIEAGFKVVAKDTYYFHGVAYTTPGPGRPADLDFIARLPDRDLYVGVQVKNRMEYPKGSDISQLIDICNTLHVRPVLVARMSHEMRNLPVIRNGGRVIIFKRCMLKPPFPKDKFQKINALGVPLGVYKWSPEFLISRFLELSKRI